MRIVVDATSLLLRSAGIKNYTYYWLQAMRQIAGRDAVDAFPFLGRTGPLHHDGSTLAPWSTYPRLAALFAANYGGPAVLDSFIGNVDIFHASNQIHHAPRRARLTATVHDVTCWKMPELHTAANVKADQRFAERILQRADGLIAVSEATRQDAIEELGIDEDRIETIHSGVPETYFNVSVEAVHALREDLKLQKPYVLFVGAIEPRKNLDRLLDAWLAMPGDIREAHELIIAGPLGWAPETAKRLTAGASGVRTLGYVPEEYLPALTAGALCFVYPSLYEGFGFPVAQAMAAGVAVLTSNISALPEIAADAALLVDPLSVNEIRFALQRLLTTPGLREDLGIRGRERADQYRWSRCARRSLDFFERLAG